MDKLTGYLAKVREWAVRTFFKTEEWATMAESKNGLYRTEVIRPREPCQHIDAVECATLECVHWFDNRRLLESVGKITPAEIEQAYYDQMEAQAEAA